MKTFIESIKIIAVALVIGWGVSGVSAEWNPPVRVNRGTNNIVTAPTSDNAKPVDAAINIERFDQIKRGGLIISTEEKSFVSPLSFFKKTLLPGADTSVYIGGASFNDPSFVSSFPGNRNVPMTIDLTGRTDNLTGAIKFKTNEQCAVSTKLINTDAPAFEFWTSKDGENSDLLAKGIKLDGGNPGPGKILISVDNKGRAVWAKPKLAANGRDIIFDPYDDSPVGVCGTPSPTPHWDIAWGGCKTIYDDSATTNIQPGQTVEYGTATCKNSSNQIVTGCTGTPWPDMNGTSPMRSAANSLPLCSTPPQEPGSDVAEQYGCHVIGSSGYWIKNRHMDYSTNPDTPKPKCTSVYIPPIPPESGNTRYAFTEGDVICSKTQPSSVNGSPTWCARPQTVDEDGDGAMDYRIDSIRNSSSPYKPCTQFQATCPN